MIKRNVQYRHYTDYAHPKDKIKALLSDTLNVTSSKQSTIPYKVLILEPDQTDIKDFLYQSTINPPVEDPTILCDHNHQVKAPWVLLFYNRTNKNSQGLQMNKETIFIEIGMFCANLTQHCLELGLHVSYTKCFLSAKNEIWKDAPVEKPILALSIGKGIVQNYPRKRPDDKDIFLYRCTVCT
jgi:hypothetical protein